MSATLTSGVLVLDDGRRIDIADAWQVNPVPLQPNAVMVNGTVHDLGAPFASYDWTSAMSAGGVVAGGGSTSDATAANQTTGNTSLASIDAKASTVIGHVDGLEAGIGAPADASWTGTGAASVIALLKRLANAEGLGSVEHVAITAGVGYVVGDRVVAFRFLNGGNVVSTVWHNATTQVALGAAPTAGHLVPLGSNAASALFVTGISSGGGSSTTPSVHANSTVTLAGASQTLVAAQPLRTGLQVINPAGNAAVWVRLDGGVAAAAAPALPLAAGSMMTLVGAQAPNGAVTIIGTAAQQVTVVELTATTGTASAMSSTAVALLAGAAQFALAASSTRKQVTISNPGPSAIRYRADGVAATLTAPSIELPANGLVSLSGPMAPSGAVSIICAAAQTITIVEGV